MLTILFLSWKPLIWVILTHSTPIQALSLREVEFVLEQLLDALTCVHSYGLIHHDVKPNNVLVQSRVHERINVK